VVGEARRPLVQVGEDHRQLALPVERTYSRETFEEDATERVDVRAAVDLSTLDLLGRDVVDRADEIAIRRQAPGRREMTSETEVANVRLLSFGFVADKDVRRLHVAVHEPGCVRGIERLGDLAKEVDRALGVEAALPPQKLPEVGSLHEPHGEVELAVFLARVDDRHDVRVIEARCKLRLAQESPSKAVVLREIAHEDLQGDPAPSSHVVGEVDAPHGALADR
jgi:hypothetical protein